MTGIESSVETALLAKPVAFLLLQTPSASSIRLNLFTLTRLSFTSMTGWSIKRSGWIYIDKRTVNAFFMLGLRLVEGLTSFLLTLTEIIRNAFSSSRHEAERKIPVKFINWFSMKKSNVGRNQTGTLKIQVLLFLLVFSTAKEVSSSGRIWAEQVFLSDIST